jgi:periplasmic divalent cation tolerance protein
MNEGARLVLMTAPSPDVAAEIVRVLLDEELVACGNILPSVTSMYRWNGRVEESSEAMVMLKTTSVLAMEVVARIEQLHPYDVPEAIVVDIRAGSNAYLRWINESTKG